MVEGKHNMAGNGKRVTVIICHQAGTAPMTEVCLEALARHTNDYQPIVLMRAGTIDIEAVSVVEGNGALLVEVDVDIPTEVSSRIHGALLDAYIPSNINTEMVMTLDSDCFPVADGWMDDLLGMLDSGARVAGILHPWEPPPESMDHHKLEWRVRSQHCWETTHVACQMLRTDDLRELGVKYNVGDDTGLLIPLEAKKRGWRVDGFRVTRCPMPAKGAVEDPEFNRYVCLVFGDKMYHHGGYSRTTTLGDNPVMAGSFGQVAEKVIFERGAEWLLNDAESYKFKFDREQQVADEKMSRLFGLGAR